MKRVTIFAAILIIAALATPWSLSSCKKDTASKTATVPDLAIVRSWLADRNATAETAALFYNLQKIAKKNILFGHQADTEQGYGWIDASGTSDVKTLTGAYPAVYGSDFLFIASFQRSAWFETQAKITREQAIAAYKRGGVNTFCWHYWNPVSSVAATSSQEGSNGDFYWDKSPVQAVAKILPGGTHHEVYKASLKHVADFAKTLISDGKAVPVIFRPFHEFDGDWFWWGKAHCTPEEYKALYRFTVQYLRDSLHVNNFLYAFSPDCNFTTETQYLERYPGNDYVDLVGMDNYHDLRVGGDVMLATAKLKIIADYAQKNNKLAALTETGLELAANAGTNDWYTNTLAKALQQQPLALAYVLLWGNRKDAYFTPYPGHAAAADFIQFKNNPYLLFGDKVPDLYTIK
ncbi:glycoside hydrolase family 26 protein [Chitinophaga arvensicola]|uniref:Mannan endo-1,4-beta-mannosidase n=1 Tax=Chitinophaga arvensicola TaxID=29529 RepID=A0A1I0SDK5_9BACT|nr:glycosyl hydrolase [Chitinophaga arvensicola]SEW56318.1 mannan endo-1,4-beta-mannosidase [Chitinophaga arvensicola]